MKDLGFVVMGIKVNGNDVILDLETMEHRCQTLAIGCLLICLDQRFLTETNTLVKTVN